MTNQLVDLLRTIGVTILITFLWAATIAYTYWDAHQQRLPERKALLWLLLVALVPLLGFIIYIARRAVMRYSPKIINGMQANLGQGTPLKHPLMKNSPLPTFLASDINLQAVLKPEKVPQAKANPRTASTKYVFTIASGPEKGKEFIISDLPATVGRGSGVAIQLDGDLGVSRRHAEIYSQEGKVRVRDLKSTHGTWLNDKRIEDQPLVTGDRIRLGLTVLMVQFIEEG